MRIASTGTAIGGQPPGESAHASSSPDHRRGGRRLVACPDARRHRRRVGSLIAQDQRDPGRLRPRSARRPLALQPERDRQSEGRAQGRGGADGRLRPRRPAERVRAAVERRLGPDGGDRRRLRRQHGRGRPQHLSLELRPARLHHRQRLLQEGQPERRSGQLPVQQPGLGARDATRSPDGLGDLSRLQDPPRGGEEQTRAPTCTRPRTPRPGSAPPRSPTATAAARRAPRPRTTPTSTTRAPRSPSPRATAAMGSSTRPRRST